MQSVERSAKVSLLFEAGLRQKNRLRSTEPKPKNLKRSQISLKKKSMKKVCLSMLVRIMKSFLALSVLPSIKPYMLLSLKDMSFSRIEFLNLITQETILLKWFYVLLEAPKMLLSSGIKLLQSKTINSMRIPLALKRNLHIQKVLIPVV